MRPATREEVLKAAQQLNALQDWQEVLDFARALYGEGVYAAKLVIDHNFDDGEEHRYLVMILAFDKLGKQLPFDFSLPFWSERDYTGKTYLEAIEVQAEQELERIQRHRRRPGEVSEQDRAKAREEAIRQVIHDDLPEVNELDFYHNEYAIDQPPLAKGEQLLTLWVDA